MVVDNEVIVDTIFESTKNKHLSEAVGSLAQACADIFGLLRVTLISNAGSANVFGDEQLTADIVAEKRMWECIADPSTHVAMGASEENPLLGGTLKATLCAFGIHWTGRPLSLVTGLLELLSL
eukprot:Gregarina_sp_Poly_1__3024@NODE_184_length_11778_cov_104_566988_g164_i0_p9_GENE_NODE_184_length_11778_cov_104_566988_g164_i0NODE_184_length_11778_cov_104_566988_g164_i0_p9_ORF_typecomplete_len123_score15_69FBPase/PF00316_20/2_5e08_NODE_184_length_11778_cov_104_566988_g164_i0191559